MSPQAIAHYKITSKLGEGGMGAVYRATDTKLSREVAIKVLTEALANDADYIARFTREAQVLASLNHPNIAAVYGIEQGAIVMELVEGRTLEGQFPVETVVDYARQIAEALEAAHEKGVVHRDLKPANIKVTPEGIVKVLDFGLAKAVEPAAAASTANSPTLTQRSTQLGVIMGTAGYMAPEQAAGKPVDKRADIWSFGVVLYELLTGAPLFNGETISHVLASVLKDPIDFTPIPRAFRGLLARCLDRNPRTRLRDIGEARVLLSRPLDEPEPLPAARRSFLPWTVAAVAILAFAGLAVRQWLRPGVSEPVVRFQFAPGRGVSYYNATPPTISPDGRRIAYISDSREGRRQIYVRSLDSPDATVVPNTAGSNVFTWSPDSRALAFKSDFTTQAVDLRTGIVRPLVKGRYLTRAAWGSRGTILLTSSGRGPLLGIPETGGTPVPATTLDSAQGEVDHDYPSFCPDGTHFLYNAAYANGRAALRLGSLDSASQSITLGDLGPAACAAAGSETYLIEVGTAALTARRLDLRSGTVGDQRWTLASGPAFQAPRPRGGAVSASSDGNLAFSLGGESEGRLIWHDRSGKALESLPASAAGISPALSPDERLVVVSRGSRFGSELWVTDLQRKTSVRMQYPQRVAALPVWSPDGAHLAFGCSGEMCEGDSSGGGQVRELSKISSWPQQYTADGRKLLYVNVARRSLELLTLDGSGKVEEVAPPGPTYFPASFAPGGGFLSYTSDESGKPEVYVRAVAPGTGKWAISNGGGGMAAWRSDGKELFYLTPDLQMMAVDVRLSPTFQAGTPKPLFKADTLSLISGRNNYVVSRDGQRFLIYRPLAESDTDPVHVVLHWPALLGKDTAVR